MGLGTRRIVGALATAALLGTAAIPSTGAATARAVAPRQLLVALHAGHWIYNRPSAGLDAVGAIEAVRPLTGRQTILPVLQQYRGRSGVLWFRVRLPGRPNGHEGWIVARDTSLMETQWHIVVKLSSRRLVVFRDGRVDRTFPVVIGRPESPTPIGHFFVEEVLSIPWSVAGAPYAFALSARSNVYAEFDGGPGQIALHGTYGIGGTPGTAGSHGCIRLESPALQWLAMRIGDGSPVTIRWR